MRVNRTCSYACLREIFVFTILLYLFFAIGVYGATLEEPSVLKGVYTWYPLDGNTMDLTFGLRDITLKSSASPASDRFGNSNGAMYFDGKNDFILLDMNINPSSEPQMSVAMWVKPEKPSGCLFSNEYKGQGRSITLENRSDLKGVSINTGENSKKFGGINIPMNEWRLIIATYDVKKKRASLYVKNQQIIKKICTDANPGKGIFTLMLGKTHNREARNHFKGSIDNVVIWTRALTEKEAEDILNNPELLSSAPRMELYNEFEKTKKLFKAGFYEKGVEKYSYVMDKGYNVRSDLKSIGAFIEGYKDIPPRFLGEISLAHYNTIMSKDKIARPGFWFKNTKSGVQVGTMFKDVPAYKAGIRTNDIITEIDGKPVKYSEDIDAYLKSKSPGDTVTITVNRSGSGKEYSFTLVEGINDNDITIAGFRLIDYGMLAAYTGHPSLAMEAAMEMRRIDQKYPGDLRSFFVGEAVVLLEALAIGVEQGADKAYERLLEYGEIKVLNNLYVTTHKDYFYPLYKDPKKLAYFIGVDNPSSLQPPKNMNPKKQAYINLKGEVVEPGGSIPVLKSQGNTGANTEKSSVKGTVLD